MMKYFPPEKAEVTILQFSKAPKIQMIIYLRVANTYLLLTVSFEISFEIYFNRYLFFSDWQLLKQLNWYKQEPHEIEKVSCTDLFNLY